MQNVVRPFPFHGTTTVHSKQPLPPSVFEFLCSYHLFLSLPLSLSLSDHISTLGVVSSFFQFPARFCGEINFDMNIHTNWVRERSCQAKGNWRKRDLFTETNCVDWCRAADWILLYLEGEWDFAMRNYSQDYVAANLRGLSWWTIGIRYRGDGWGWLSGNNGKWREDWEEWGWSMPVG